VSFCFVFVPPFILVNIGLYITAYQLHAYTWAAIKNRMNNKNKEFSEQLIYTL